MREPLSYPYLRQSLGREKQGSSVDVQLKAARDYHARTPGLPPWSTELERSFEDIHTDSASNFADRKAGRALLIAAVPGDCVIFHHLDRLGRTIFGMIQTIELLKKRGLKLHILDAMGAPMDIDSPFGQMMVAAFAFAATLEKQRIGERTRAYIQYKKSQGLSPVALPKPGKMRVPGSGGVMVDDPEQLKVLNEATRLANSGWTVMQIVQEFKRRGYLNPYGRPWSHSVLGRWIQEERAALGKLRKKA